MTLDSTGPADRSGDEPSANHDRPDAGQNERRLTAFESDQRLATGGVADVARAVKAALARAGVGRIMIFDDATGASVDLDAEGDLHGGANLSNPVGFAGGAASQSGGAPDRSPKPVGRPRLGVVAREVTLLPRHWDWLNRQPGGASVALRKLVDEARRVHRDADATRVARERAYRFMLAMGGDLPGYEEALRALFAGDHQRFDVAVLAWPRDVRTHAQYLATGSWTANLAPTEGALT